VTTRPLTTLIEPHPPQRWRLGIFDNPSSGLPRIEDVTRLGNGVAYNPIDATVGVGVGFDPCATDISIVPDESDTADSVEWQAWGVAMSLSCSTLTGGADLIADQEARVRAKMEAQSSYAGERIFWSGDITSADTMAGQGWSNSWLANGVTATTLGANEVGVVTAFGLIHEYLADTLQGLRGVIHVPPILLPYLAHYRVVNRDQFTLGTALSDHIVAAGSGYLGTDPDGADPATGITWIYATSMVRTAQTDIVVRSEIDRAENLVIATASRTQLAEWDLQAHAAVEVCLPDPGPACT
jgi:hypothetical protein